MVEIDKNGRNGYFLRRRRTRIAGLLSLPSLCLQRAVMLVFAHCSYIQKGWSTFKIQSWLQKMPALSTANRHQQIIIPLGILSCISPASKTKIYFLFPSNFFLLWPTQHRWKMCCILFFLCVINNINYSQSYQASQLKGCKPAEPFCQGMANWNKRLGPTIRSGLQSCQDCKLKIFNLEINDRMILF